VVIIVRPVRAQILTARLGYILHALRPKEKIRAGQAVNALRAGEATNATGDGFAGRARPFDFLVFEQGEGGMTVNDLGIGGNKIFFEVVALPLKRLNQLAICFLLPIIVTMLQLMKRLRTRCRCRSFRRLGTMARLGPKFFEQERS